MNDDIDEKSIYYALPPLLALAEKSLPAKANDFAEASRQVSATLDHDGTTFMPASSGGATELEITWCALRDELVTILLESRTNLVDTSTAVMGFVNETTKHDADNAAELERYSKNFNKSFRNKEGVNPYPIDPKHPAAKPEFEPAAKLGMED